MKQQPLLWIITGVVLSLFAPGTGHFLEGMWVRGAAWLGGLFAGGVLLYYIFPSAEITYYSAFGVLIALLAALDLLMAHRSRAVGDEEPTILKPDEHAR